MMLSKSARPNKSAHRVFSYVSRKFAFIMTCTATLLIGPWTFIRRSPFYQSSHMSYEENQPYLAGYTRHQNVSIAFLSRIWNHLTGLTRLLLFLVLIFYMVVVLQLNLKNIEIERAINVLDRLGPMYTKLLQWASTRPDLLDDRVIIELQRTTFYSSVHSYEKTLEILKEENLLGTLIDSVAPDILGSGSVAQVHKGELCSGEQVAIKILHPNIEVACLRDLDFFLSLAWLLDMFFPYARFYDSALEFRQFMLSQFDMVHEAYNLDRFRINFKGIKEVSFPKVFFDATSHRVLTQEFIEGATISELVASNKLKERFSSSDRKNLASIGARAFFKMLFIDNFTHGDLHAGNIMIRKQTVNNPRWNQQCFPLYTLLFPPNLSLVFLDCGLAFRLSQREEKNFIALFHAIAQRKFRLAAELFLEKAPFSNCQNKEEYINNMETVLSKLDEDNNEIHKINFGNQLHQIWRTLINHRIGIESKFTSLLSSIAVVEGVSKTLDAKINIVLTSLPFLVQRMALDPTSLSFLIDLIVI